MRWLVNHGYALMVLTAVAWSGNTIIGRGLNDVLPPLGLAFWRWFAVLPLFLILAWPHLRQDMPLILRHWKILFVLSALSVSLYNSIIYIALTSTTAINAFLINTSRPIIIVMLSFAIFSERITLRQIAGLLVGLLGTAVIITRGDLAVLRTLSFNIGDIWVLVATIAWAFYTVLLPKKPKIHATSFMAATVTMGIPLLLPFYLWETITVKPMPLIFESIWGVAYLALIATGIAYLSYNRTVELLGANKAGLTSYLLPIFGTILAIIVLGEEPRYFHGVGFALILAGIFVATRRKT
ncbi:MAG: DMT family transporter [Proteobacteria bacterium]|nr:DMT family transporter [Pseudomonadota bacterium]